MSFRVTSCRPMISLSVIVAACAGPNAPSASETTRTVTAATFDSLPRLAIVDGPRVCSSDSLPSCPTLTGVANWVDGGHFLLWQPGRVVELWSGGGAPVAIGSLGREDGQYTGAVAAGAKDGGIEVIDGPTKQVLQYDGRGQFVAAKKLPDFSFNAAFGFSGKTPLLQVIRSKVDSGPASIEVRVVSQTGDSTGRTAVEIPLPWLRLHDNTPLNQLPFFAPIPVFALYDTGDVVWSAGDHFELERRDAQGAAQWRLTGRVTGDTVTAADIAARRTEILASPLTSRLLVASIDSMAAATAPHHPAITGLILAPSGRVLVAGQVVPASDSITFYMVAPTGEMTGRFTLPKTQRVLLFGGDSVLVMRPVSGATEVRWLRMEVRK